MSTRVVSWNEAAEMKLSVESEALVMPRRSGVPSAGSPPRFITFSFSKTLILTRSTRKLISCGFRGSLVVTELLELFS